MQDPQKVGDAINAHIVYKVKTKVIVYLFSILTSYLDVSIFFSFQGKDWMIKKRKTMIKTIQQ